VPTYEYICDECDSVHTQIRAIDDRLRDSTCPHCQGQACYIVSAPMTKLDGTDPSFPGEWNKWEKKREQVMKQERKCLERHGTER